MSKTGDSAGGPPGRALGQSPVRAKTFSIPSAWRSSSVLRRPARSWPTHVTCTLGVSPRARAAVPTRIGSWPIAPPA